jgi:hypothetical protein
MTVTKPKEVTDAQFEAEVLKSETPGWDFGRPVALSHIALVEELADEAVQMKFVKVNTDGASTLPQLRHSQHPDAYRL